MNFRCIIVYVFVTAASLFASVTFDVVADYGADPNCKNDSSVAFQKALTAAAKTNTDVTIIFPPGCYKIKENSFFMMNSDIEKKITIKGFGINTTTIRITGTNGFLKCFQKGKSADLTLELHALLFVAHSLGGTVVEFKKEKIDRDEKSYFLAEDICIFAAEENLNTSFGGAFFLSGVGNPKFINVKVDSTRSTKFNQNGSYYYPLNPFTNLSFLLFSL